MKTNKSTIWRDRLWAMDQQVLTALLASDAPYTTQQEPPVDDPQYDVNNGVATISIVGPLMKYADIFTLLFGGVSSVQVQDALSAANADPSVSAVLLYIDSPGGTVSGTVDLADAVAASTKPVFAYICDSGCSAAYWIASQARKVWINRAGYAGSIGVYGTVVDYSGMYASEGVKVNLVKAGKYKGVGEPGTEITPDDLVPLQREIDAMYELFVASVAKGRGLSPDKVRAVADGQSYIASEALALGLVDGVVSNDQVITTILGEIQMSQTEEVKPVVAPQQDAPADEAPVDAKVGREDRSGRARSEKNMRRDWPKGKAEEKARFEAIRHRLQGRHRVSRCECFLERA
jgi:signal peptide peptidase SppA